MTTDDGYADWLRSNPAPDLQVLVGCHGGYAKIPAEAWTEHDRTMAEWQERRRNRSAGAPSSEIRDSDRADREAVRVCGLSGISMRLRKGGGRAIWRCQQHRNLWPDYAEEIPARRAAE
jgi:hypothetical protein